MTRLFAMLVIVLLLLYLAVVNKLLAIFGLAAMGFFAFSIVPGMQLYVVQLAERHLPGTEDIASTLNIAAFNVGIALGSYVGAGIVGSAWGIRSVTLMSAGFVVLAFLFSLLSRNKERSNKI